MTEKELRIKLSDLCNEAYQAGLDSTAVNTCVPVHLGYGVSE